MSEIATSKPPAFEGKAGKTYTIWEMKFKAYAHEKGFLAALLDIFKTKLPMLESVTLDPTDPAEKAKIEAKEQNGKAIHAMIGSFKKSKDMNKIMAEQCQDAKNWPTGKAYKVWEALQKKYQPDNSMSEVDME